MDGFGWPRLPVLRMAALGKQMQAGAKGTARTLKFAEQKVTAEVCPAWEWIVLTHFTIDQPDDSQKLANRFCSDPGGLFSLGGRAGRLKLANDELSKKKKVSFAVVLNLFVAIALSTLDPLPVGQPPWCMYAPNQHWRYVANSKIRTLHHTIYGFLTHRRSYFRCMWALWTPVTNRPSSKDQNLEIQ